MSAPKTNLEKQQKRHGPALYGLGAALLVVVVAAVIFMMWGGIPLDEQAAPDGEPTEMAPETPADE